MTIRKKHVVRGLLAFLLVSFTPLYDYLLGGPETLTISGKAPPGSKVKALTGFRTETPWCRTYSLGTGKFLPYGSWAVADETETDASGNYCVRVPLERKSLWCDWEGAHGVNLYATIPTRADPGRYRRIRLAHISFEDTPSVPVLEMECADTFDLSTFAEGGRAKPSSITPCRPAKASYPYELVRLNEGFDAPRFPLRKPEGKLELNIRLVEGPDYPLRYNAKEYWDIFDAGRGSEAPNILILRQADPLHDFSSPFFNPPLPGGDREDLRVLLLPREGRYLAAFFQEEINSQGENVISYSGAYEIPKQTGGPDPAGMPVKIFTEGEQLRLEFADGTKPEPFLPPDAVPIKGDDGPYAMRWDRVFGNCYHVTVYRGPGMIHRDALMTDGRHIDLAAALGESSRTHTVPGNGTFASYLGDRITIRNIFTTDWPSEFPLVEIREDTWPKDFPNWIHWVP